MQFQAKVERTYTTHCKVETKDKDTILSSLRNQGTLTISKIAFFYEQAIRKNTLG